MAKKKTQKKQLTKKDQKPSDPLYEFVDSLDTNIVYNPKCKLCNSQHREEAEEHWERVGNLNSVYKLLISKGEDIHKTSVRNHLYNHFAKPFREQRLKEYAENVSEWNQMRQNKEQRLQQYLVLLDRQIHMLNAMTDENDVNAMRKTSDMVAKLMDQAAKVEDKLEEHREKMEPINVFVERFKDTMLEKLDNINSDEGRKALVDILETVEKDAEDILSNE